MRDLSSRFDQQANSPGSWTKLALKPLLLKRIQNASLETCAQLAPPLLPSLPGCILGAAPDWMFHRQHLVTKMDQVLMSCGNILEEKHKTKHAGENWDLVSWLTSLLHADILTNSPGSWAKLALNHPLLHKRIQNASWETCVRRN
ncbi:Amiloride-sensitive sodium channel subunit gamma [Frankliniella fusca]|uniref:Amiloride-sensitive sodium channel subunit gamma n=1 Tax=Frankliniella fusca TaxID=407009 RepID=A0AAE1LBI6_9NEOP|nr:Amiloride-sensitive sodium channel subunit gamma [Frankliniella fusca]KAK3912068.1 Amiloride-sensitive sodium channel subunit gamma [Frankliniella fusca]